jgi:UPF0755 protein
MVATGLATLVTLGVGLLIVESRPYRGWEGEAVVVTVPPGSSTRDIARLLADAGVLRFPRLFSLRARLAGDAGRLDAGEYRFDRPLSPGAVLDVLEEGRIVLHEATVPEGLTLEETAARLAEQGWGSHADLLEAFHDPSPVSDLDPEAPDLEGYLFPDTYALPRGADPEEIVRVMVQRFRDAVAELGWRSDDGAGLREMVTLASLVEKETAVAEERAVVAGVFAERLRRGWRLECDPTVRYALRRDGRMEEERPLTRGDLAYESPFNTYRSDGLPPGPICNPGAEALAAAFRPAETEALYFVAVGDGSGRHAFSSTLRGHLANVARYRERRDRRSSADRSR